MLSILPLLIAVTLTGIGLPDGGEPRFTSDLELPTIDGERTVRLSQLRGKKLLLVEFASW
jgi:hypothetical protein